MDNQDRIAQWRKMTEADGENAMGWLSLGAACREAGQLEEAGEALRKAIELDGGLSRAYQLLAQVCMSLGQRRAAGEVLVKGYTVAAQRGDVMPQRAMGSLLQKLGLELPPVAESAPAAEPTSQDQVMDRRTGQAGTRLADPPMRGPLGRFIYDHYSVETWREWLRLGTKVINELRLDFSNRAHQDVYEQHMKEWLGISDEEVAEYAQRPER